MEKSVFELSGIDGRSCGGDVEARGSMPNKREGLWGEKQFCNPVQPSVSPEKRDFSVPQILIMKSL